LALAAIRAYRRYDLQSAFQCCQELIRVDPLTPCAALCHAATLLALNYKRLLFALAHEWVKASPQAAKSWFAVGCYYYCCQRYHIAQQHFFRATRLDPNCQDA
jgi:tetratricopeptide (TPR) repeat protein